VIDINEQEFDQAVLQHRPKHTAGATPGGPKINHHRRAMRALEHRLVKLLFVDVDHGCLYNGHSSTFNLQSSISIVHPVPYFPGILLKQSHTG
jgi:hypothetical protein